MFKMFYSWGTEMLNTNAINEDGVLKVSTTVNSQMRRRDTQHNDIMININNFMQLGFSWEWSWHF
jgi:hypothetical protein